MITLLLSFFLQSYFAEASNICRHPAQACQASFQMCSSDYECCSKLCARGVCAPEPSQGGCAIPGEYCVFANDCCSGSCVRGQCSGSEEYKAPLGVACDYNFQCKSGVCDFNTRTCVGSPNDCASVGNRCTLSAQCCSGLCERNTCVGTADSEKRSGTPCQYNFQCPRYCDIKTRRCI